MVQVIFYQAGEISISGGMRLLIDSPGAVMLKVSDGVVKEITVVDPSRKLVSMHLQISGMDDLIIELSKGVYPGHNVITEL